MTGGAVDIGLVDFIPMGAEFDETSERSVTHYFEKKTTKGDYARGEGILFTGEYCINAMIESNFQIMQKK